MPQFIGIAGKAQSGKTTAAEIAAAMTGGVVKSLAQPLYDMLEVLRTGDWPADREQPIPGLGRSRRQLLQTLGTEWGRDLISPTLWVDHLTHRCRWLSAKQVVFVPDVRFDNEAAAIIEAGGKVWGITGRGGIAGSHSSEDGIRWAYVSRWLDNQSTLDDLRSQITTAVQEDIGHGA
jgi:hypothetical protein